MTISVVILAIGGSRALVGCTDSVARQSAPPADVHLALPAASKTPATIITSIERRLAAAPAEGPHWAQAVNAAVKGASGAAVALVPATCRLDRRMLERCGETLDQGVAVVAPGLVIMTPDGRQLRTVRFDAHLQTAVADPHAIPPVLVFTRAAWIDAGPLDPSFGDLAGYEWWVRLLASGVRAASLEAPLVQFEATAERWWPAVPTGESYLNQYRNVLQTHRGAIERELEAVLVEREVSFGRLLERHRDLTRRRDADLAELDRLRADAAHHRAYLAHYGRDGFDWGDWRRTDPLSRNWGYERGEPIDRHYIDAFLAAHSSDVRGSVLEVQEDDFAGRFGGSKVERRTVLDIDERNPRATVLTDLRSAALPDGAFDCIILTQTLHVIDDMTAVVRECYRLLRPGGVLLATLPCASRVCLEYGADGDLWRVTPAGARALVEPVFGAAHVECTTFGNVLTNVAFLQGLARADLTAAEFAATDDYYPALVGVRARKPLHGRRRSSLSQGVVLLYHRIHDAEDVHGLNVPVALFEAQLAMLARECRPMPLEELLLGARDGLPDGAVALTFDDGYADTLEVASPLLERYGVPATVFATTRWLEGPGEYWWDTLERILLDPSTPAALEVEIDARHVRFDTSTASARSAGHRRLHEWLVHAPLDGRDRVMRAVTAWHAGGRASYRPLLAGELRQLAGRPGITIGAHSVNHLALPDQPLDALTREVRESAAALERLLDRRIDLFAFPYGAVDDRSADAVRVAYRWGVTCEARPIDASFDAARVPRLEVTCRQGPDILRALVSSPRASA
jgi:peptidoglycan/xylan/chitin deacetylase (PgdA/CDA1 family)